MKNSLEFTQRIKEIALQDEDKLQCVENLH